MNIDRDSGTTEAIIQSLNRLGERVNEIESAMATHNHIAEDDEVNMKEVFDWASLTNENHQLCIANQILHDKVVALRAENKLLADICEERDAQIAASIKRERQYVAMLKLCSVCNA